MSYDYWKWDKVIPKEYCNVILNSINWDKKIDARINSGEKALEKRKTDIVWEMPLSVIGCIADKYIRIANICAGWDFNITNIDDIQIGKYHSNGFYDWHIDTNKKEDIPRKLSFSMLLNDCSEFEEGKFEFKNLDEQPILEQGTIIVFPSDLLHRVTPVTKGERISAVTWMRGPKFK